MPSADLAGTIAALESRATFQRTWAENGGSIVWRSWGEGPPLVLLHGGHGSWRHWIRNIPALSATHRVIAPDLPGMGDSATIGDGSSMDYVADALAAGIDGLGFGGRYALGGFSLGSIVAGYVLARHRHRVEHLLLVGSGGLGRYELATGRLKRWQEEADPVRRLALHRHNLAALMLHDPASIDDLAVAIQAFNAEHTRINHRAAATSADLSECLRSNPVRVTAIWGAEDVLVRKFFDERRALVASFNPPGRFHLVPNAGHWVQYEAAQAVNALMAAALGQEDAAGREAVGT